MKAKDKALLRKHWIELSRRRTEYGWEKLCPCCGEWWPLTDDYFSFITTRGHYHSHCRACRAEDQAQRRQRARTTNHQTEMTP